MALPFDPAKLSPAGPAIPIAQDVMQAGTTGFGALSASENGVLLYRSGDYKANETLTWLDRSGRQIEVKSDAQPFTSLALSPDGKRAAVTITSQESGEIWLQDLERGLPTKFTFGPARSRSAVWSSDGSYIVYTHVEPKRENMFRKAANTGAAEELLQELAGFNATPLDISPDGKMLVYSATEEKTKDDLWLLPLQGNHKPVKFLDSPFEERHAQVDGIFVG